MRSKNFYAMEARRKKYKERIGWLFKVGIIELEPNEMSNNTFPLKKAKITFDIYFEVNRRRDKQNYLGGGLITWLDVLVDFGYIADDNSDCIDQPIVNFYIDKTNPRCEIIIEGRG